MSVVYLNGEYLPLEEAKVSVLDRGFTFADAVYEIIPVYNGRILRLDKHLQRLDNSLSEIFIKNPFSKEDWALVFHEVLNRNENWKESSLYIQVSRGTGDRMHVFEDQMSPTIFIMPREVKKQDHSAGVRVITSRDIRWDYRHIKATALLPSVLLKRRAMERNGAVEAILHDNGKITEGAASNVFVVKNGEVRTPQTDGAVLPGITRGLIIELLEKADIPCSEVDVSIRELNEADEVWISSATMGVVAVISIDEKPVGDGKPGPVWSRINTVYQDYKANPE